MSESNTSSELRYVGADPGHGFGIHFVNVSNHLTTGGLSVSEVEDHFANKLGNMSTFDAFMDFNAMFHTSDLSGYVEKFKADNVPMYATTWTYESQTWTSVFVHVPNSQLTIELCQDVTLEHLWGYAVPEHAIPRISPRAARMITSLTSTTTTSSKILTPIAVNRAISKSAMNDIEDFYVKGMRTQLIDALSSPTVEDPVSKKCFLWTGASVDVCFYERDEDATKGDWKVSDFETMLNSVHANFLGKNPLCGQDKVRHLETIMTVSLVRSTDSQKITQHNARTAKSWTVV